MDQELRRVINACMPKLNPAIARGLAYEQLEWVEPYVDAIWKAVAKTFPPTVKFAGGVRCTPEQAFEQATRRKESRRNYEVSRSSLFLMEYTLTLDVRVPETGKIVQKPIKRFVYLPWCKPAGEMDISGGRHFISPVVADKVISKSGSGVFVRLVRDKFTIEQETHDVIINSPAEINGTQRVSRKFAHARIYKRAKDVNGANVGPEVKAKTTLMLYQLCKYGFSETFRRFCNGMVPRYGTAAEINEEEYPIDKWAIISSTGDRIGNRRMIARPIVHLAVPREQYMADPKLGSMIASFFYVVDHFPERLREPLVDYLDNTRWWRILLGYMLQEPGRGDGALADAMNEHIQSLDEYVDRVMIRRFMEIGMPVNDIYEFFDVVEGNLQEWILEGGRNAASVYGKELNVLNFLLAGITEGINTFGFKLTKKYSKKPELTVKDIEDLLQRYVRTGLIFAITRENSEVQPGSAPGDNMAFKITGMSIPQSASSKTAARNTGKASPETLLHISVAEHCGYGNPPKRIPDGRARLNHYTHLTPDYILVRNPDIIKEADRVQYALMNKLPPEDNRY